MQIRIKIEIIKILNLDFELSSSGKPKEDKKDEKKELPAPNPASK